MGQSIQRAGVEHRLVTEPGHAGETFILHPMSRFTHANPFKRVTLGCLLQK